MLGAVIVHPEKKTVLPLVAEPIMREDGSEKNDCERNAAKRFVEKLRMDHPELPMVMVEDSLSSNAPHIRLLMSHNIRFILGVKKGDHKFLFNLVDQKKEAGETVEFEMREKGVTHRFHFVNNVPLNESNPDLLVNFLEYWEISDKGTKHFSWVTDFLIHQSNAYLYMRGGRVRWKTENETFNTLKNRGYHFEHNFGHGDRYLSVIFAHLMFLAFFVDQLLEATDSLFQAALEKVGSKKRLWQKIRSLFFTLSFDSMETLYKAIIYGYRIEQIVILDDSS